MENKTKESWKAATKRYYYKNKERRNAYNRAYYAANKERARKYLPKAYERKRHQAELLTNLKLELGCQNPGCACKGTKLEASQLDFHHVGQKTFSIGQGRGRSLKSLYAEICKCTVLCANCHRLCHHGTLDAKTLRTCKPNWPLAVKS